MYDIEVKAGKTIRYDIWFTGEPEPDVTWEKNGMNLGCDESGRVTIENFVKKGVYCEKNSVLTIVKADRREDSGQYKIRLTCSGGGGEATGQTAQYCPYCPHYEGVNFRQCQCYRCPIQTEKFHCRRGKSGTFIFIFEQEGVWGKCHHYPQNMILVSAFSECP